MNSRQLFKLAGIEANVPDLEISEIVFDSRQACKGKVFVALRGSHTDGHKYIDNAKNAGCEIIMSEEKQEGCVLVADTKHALAYLSHTFYGFPSKSINLCGMTATNGKTTTTHIIATLLKGIDPNVGLVGTAGHYLPSGRIQPDINNPTTTPYPTIIDQYLLDMKNHGSKYAVLELSSFGLEGGRVIGLEFESIGIGNITHCHHAKLHKTHENYVEVKLKSLELLSPNGTAVLNVDDEYFDPAKKYAKNHRIITFGKNSGDIYIQDYRPTIKGSTIKANIFGKSVEYAMNVPSFSNALNSLCAIGIVEGMSINAEPLLQSLSDMIEIPGRWNWIDCGQEFTVVVDKANTPAALETVADHMDSVKPGRKIIITNNVGEGDPKAREKLAEIASKRCDLTIITYGVAKNEDLDFTVSQFAEFMDNYGGKYKIVTDRTEAIHWAVKNALCGDFIAILGRGDEDGMNVKGIWIEVDDRIEARKALVERGFECN